MKHIVQRLIKKILDYYRKYEINGDTPDDFRYLLNSRMRLIMPKYNWLYFANDLLDEDESILDEFLRTLNQSTTGNLSGTQAVKGTQAGNTITDGENTTESENDRTGTIANKVDGTSNETRTDHGESDNTATTTNDLTTTNNGTTTTNVDENTTQNDITKNYDVPIQGTGAGGLNDTFVRTANGVVASGHRDSETTGTNQDTTKNTGTVKSTGSGTTDGTGSTERTESTVGDTQTTDNDKGKSTTTNHSETQNTGTTEQDVTTNNDTTGTLDSEQKGFNTPKYRRIAELYNVFHNVDLEIIQDPYLMECFIMYHGSDLSDCGCYFGWWW